MQCAVVERDARRDSGNLPSAHAPSSKGLHRATSSIVEPKQRVKLLVRLSSNPTIRHIVQSFMRVVDRQPFPWNTEKDQRRPRR
jgi:hypothetical protein